MLKEIDDSKFNMWRAIVALVHSDSQIHEKEEHWMLERFERLPFSEDQLKTLKDDMTRSQDVWPFFEKITHPADRAHFVYFARLLFWSDGDFHGQESAILERLNQATLDKVDLEAIMKSVDGIADQFQREHESRGFRDIVVDFIDKLLG